MVCRETLTGRHLARDHAVHGVGLPSTSSPTSVGVGFSLWVSGAPQALLFWQWGRPPFPAAPTWFYSTGWPCQIMSVPLTTGPSPGPVWPIATLHGNKERLDQWVTAL